MAVAVVVGSAVLGGFFGGRVLAGQDRLDEQYEVFSTALAAVEITYVGEVDSEQLVYRATAGMLQRLDPHSNFMDPRNYARLRERQGGRYYGLGISINVINGDITVMSLFEGSPAYRRGIRRGDVIARIEGEDASGITSDDAVRQLRGPKGSTVTVSIRRRGYDELIDLEVERDEIHIPTVKAAFMIDDATGYVLLGDFSETSSRELRQALRKLDGLGMEQLLLDLRDNPGGPLDQAIRVSNQFLPRGELIVYTRGRIQNSDQDYNAREDGGHVDIPLVVLVNRQSASAAEIVSGAVQDHDLLPRLGRRLQDQGQGVNERIVTGAHILQVEHQDVGVRQHGPGGPPCLPVQAVKRQIRVRIPITLPLHHVVLGLAVNAVLGAHDRNQVDLGMLPEEVDDVAEAGVHRGGVGDDGDPLSGHQVQPSVQKEVKTRSNLHQPLIAARSESGRG